MQKVWISKRTKGKKDKAKQQNEKMVLTDELQLIKHKKFNETKQRGKIKSFMRRYEFLKLQCQISLDGRKFFNRMKKLKPFWKRRILRKNVHVKSLSRRGKVWWGRVKRYMSDVCISDRCTVNHLMYVRWNSFENVLNTCWTVFNFCRGEWFGQTWKKLDIGESGRKNFLEQSCAAKREKARDPCYESQWEVT